ncbi:MULTISPECIES: LTA synthase family protein [unclassified Treponema]|uniref:LTA synthase family protein n=1 Tax=unclassified Treponema TaxID=2638727 RepID=UPI0020A3000F|nr:MULTISPECIES: LTA synthase family protein [unclassified Treponema]UTC66896.1 LTA synthase family protein [Treponema sp. OMZ 789]UTC69625.1 LTA synthase family protein [Treponema sp. OMZ 790]UTC72339.1 LTA synthase family protein [Treponema sp. OMZ 791]
MFVSEKIEFASKKEKKKQAFLGSLFVLLYAFIVMIIIWLLGIFPHAQIDQLIFTAVTPIDGTSSAVLVSFYLKALAVPVILSLVNLILILKEVKLVLKTKKGKIYRLFPVLIKRPRLYILIYICIFLGYSQYKFEYIQYAYYKLSPPTDLYEKNYIDPAKVEFSFPQKKRNLIILYLESMEISAVSKEFGGLSRYDLIPELRKIAEQNLSFSHSEQLGGVTQVVGTSHSIASLTCLNLGVPLILNLPSFNSYFSASTLNSSAIKINRFMEGGYGLGDLLYDNGYNLIFSMAADKDFGCLGNFLTDHKNFKVQDYSYFVENGRIPKDYNVWWGFEDEKLYQFAREDITALSKEEKPFAYIFFTADTHSPHGYADEKCPNIYFEKIHNVYAGASKKAYDFVEWAKTQPFYQNTTIVILGDHLYMGGDLYLPTVKLQDRHPYNAFINSAKTTDKNKNRQFTTFDLFPTIVESLGIEFNAKGLGLGRSLFSDQKTLLEEKGLKKLNSEIEKPSIFYEEKLMKKH